MSIKEAYNNWAKQYDTNINKTRDLEAKALREILSLISFERCLEIGCGTGKNTEWLSQKATDITAVDLSEEMLLKAKEKISSSNVTFEQADITKEWNFKTGIYDLVTFSLVLEHIEDLDLVFKETSSALITGGFVYIGELHPFKQYAGSKARFETEKGTEVLQCYTHNISDFTQSAKRHKLQLIELKEYFDKGDGINIPRILCLLFQKL